MNKAVTIGKGKLAGKGVFAAKDFKEGTLVEVWNLQRITQEKFEALPKSEQTFVHSFWSQMYLFSEPERYTNHSPNPNTVSDFKKHCSYATRDIKSGEMITTNATEEIKFEVKSFLEAREGKIEDFKWLKGGYRNAEVQYSINGKTEQVKLKRMGNWHTI